MEDGRIDADFFKVPSKEILKICFTLFFYVLFLCKFVRYYCHRVSTKLQLTNISCKILFTQEILIKISLSCSIYTWI